MLLLIVLFYRYVRHLFWWLSNPILRNLVPLFLTSVSSQVEKNRESGRQADGGLNNQSCWQLENSTANIHQADPCYPNGQSSPLVFLTWWQYGCVRLATRGDDATWRQLLAWFSPTSSCPVSLREVAPVWAVVQSNSCATTLKFRDRVSTEEVNACACSDG